MKAQEFWERFKENIYQNSELVSTWDNTKDFTNSIMDKLENNVIVDKNIKTEREYFRIDLVGYIKKESTKTLHWNLQKYSWDLEVAVEHENDYRLWVDEVVKLAHIVCPLRVVIGYLPKNSEKYSHEVVLKKVVENLKEVKAWESSSKTGDFMIIIGDCKVSSESERCVYTPYLYNYDTETFELLKK